ncbi:MAG: adenosine kinase [Alphaproteobacteria bacterium]|nr:adenosine kinase [Alphaproteobacteria bacterium]
MPSQQEYLVDYDVLTIGNAIVDIMAEVSDEFIAKNSFKKGLMTLIDEDEAKSQYHNLLNDDDAKIDSQCSGGSAANTAVGVSSLGGKTAYIGKVHWDDLGNLFIDDIHSKEVHFTSTPAIDGASTARCLVMVTPDAQRTMHTYLGACTELSENDIDENLIARSNLIYLEGYLWYQERAKQAIVKACQLAHQHKRKIAFTLSDAFCVENNRAEFLDLIENNVDILFANEDEIKSLFETDDFDKAIRKAAAMCELVTVTRGEKGATAIQNNDELISLEAQPIKKVIDTTGAGDLYAAGFLYGYAKGMNLNACIRIGGLAAAEIISHYGARPKVKLKELI